MTNDEYFYPIISDVQIDFYFPPEVIEAPLITQFGEKGEA
jgi:hypothetical protein